MFLNSDLERDTDVNLPPPPQTPTYQNNYISIFKKLAPQNCKAKSDYVLWSKP